MAAEGSRWLEPVFCMQYLGGVDHIYCQNDELFPNDPNSTPGASTSRLENPHLRTFASHI